MTDLIRISNDILSWHSQLLKIDGIPFNGFTALNHGEKRERTIVHAGRRDGRPVGKTAGKYSANPIALTMLRDSADKLTTYLTAKGLGSYGDAEFVLFMQAIEAKAGALITVVATGCTIDSINEPSQEGIDPLLTEFEIGAMELTKNGKRLWSVVRGIP